MLPIQQFILFLGVSMAILFAVIWGLGIRHRHELDRVLGRAAQVAPIGTGCSRRAQFNFQRPTPKATALVRFAG